MLAGKVWYSYSYFFAKLIEMQGLINRKRGEADKIEHEVANKKNFIFKLLFPKNNPILTAKFSNMKLSTITFILAAFFVFSACEKAGFDKDGWDKKEWIKEDKGICFELIYPVTYLMPDESSLVAEDEKSFWTAIKEWYEANPEVEEKPELQYPVDILYKDESTETIQNEEEMIAAKKDCSEDD